ncbi:hypothetical protein SDC9_121526 [bioreactor metagenome]|uniref:Uncharacterized protein n=1 Tax=bioreactor metagenome TaxID=1076179 RepID=A0A645CCC0_9ZZZZ
MVDERTSTTSADPIHALLHIVIEISNFRIFAAKLNCSISRGKIFPDACCASDNLLYERQMQTISKAYTGRTCDNNRK